MVQLDGSNELFSNAPATDRNVLADVHPNKNYDKASGEGRRSPHSSPCPPDLGDFFNLETSSQVADIPLFRVPHERHVRGGS